MCAQENSKFNELLKNSVQLQVCMFTITALHINFSIVSLSVQSLSVEEESATLEVTNCLGITGPLTIHLTSTSDGHTTPNKSISCENEVTILDLEGNTFYLVEVWMMVESEECLIHNSTNLTTTGNKHCILITHFKHHIVCSVQ